MMVRSDQEIPFPRTQDIRVSETWGWGQREEKTGQGERGGGGEGGGEQARKGSKSDWLPLSFKISREEWVEEK